jgi:nitrogen-specific signal transduction histidine kinase
MIENGFIGGLTSAVWYFDEKQISNHLDGILKIADIAELNLNINKSSRNLRNKNLSNNGPVKIIQLEYLHEGMKKQVGSLEIYLSLDKVYKKLEKKFIIVLLSNAIKTFLVSYFIFIMFNRLVTRPLEEIAIDAKKMSEKQLKILTIESEKQNIENLVKSSNELEVVQAAINIMQENFNQTINSVKKNEERMKDIAMFTSDVIFETDLSFNINYLEKSTNNLEFFNQIKLGLNLFDLNIEKEALIVLKKQIEMFSDGHAIQSLIFEIHTNGKINYYSISMKAILTTEFDQVKLKGYRGLIVDITSRKEYESKIEEQKEHIKQIQKLDAVGELTAGIAHDFNNVLSVITASLKNISRLEIDHDKLNKYLIKAQNSSEKGIKLSKRLLSFSRRQESEEREVNLNEVIDSLSDILEVAISSSTKLTRDFEISLLKTKIDLNMFENVLINLCVNSRDALTKVDNAEIIISTKNVNHNGQSMVLLSLKDNGSGMPATVKSRIFEPFFTTKEKDKGTGLGLSMVFNFVKEYQGDIEVDSTVGEGTCFKLYLPSVA